MTTPTPPVAPTQTRYPWRATLRTVAAAGLGALSLLPVAAATAGVDTLPAVAQAIVVAGAITRVLALPGVDAWLRQYVPWLAAAPNLLPQNRGSHRAIATLLTVLGVAGHHRRDLLSQNRSPAPA
ncbi:hypothetical protein KBX53_12815 [Micromonospora sp. M51]|uniref:hypothetical protein n=1 Tax=Micromonospora TaxID=1873 RepID=UPI0012DE1DF1|nr:MULTISPECIES: hypothetical protein [Micromonospora]MBQ1011811.1 hypothetical protein [Micromonospora sp. M51]MBQ1030413.1 hypothetical protein [Micromonospora sp. C97]